MKHDARDEAAANPDPYYRHTTYGWITKRGENEEAADAGDSDSLYTADKWISKRGEHEA